MAIGETLSGAVDYAKRKPAVAVAVGAGVVGLGVWVYLQSRTGGGSVGTPGASVPSTPAAPTPTTPPPPGVKPDKPVGATLPGFPSGDGPIRPPKKSNLEKMPGLIIGDKTGDTGKGGTPGKPINQKGLPYRCPKGSFLTWERGRTGNQVCQKPDGTQFAVVPIKAKK